MSASENYKRSPESIERRRQYSKLRTELRNGNAEHNAKRRQQYAERIRKDENFRERERLRGVRRYRANPYERTTYLKEWKLRNPDRWREYVRRGYEKKHGGPIKHGRKDIFFWAQEFRAARITADEFVGRLRSYYVRCTGKRLKGGVVRPDYRQRAENRRANAGTGTQAE